MTTIQTRGDSFEDCVWRLPISTRVPSGSACQLQLSVTAVVGRIRVWRTRLLFLIVCALSNSLISCHNPGIPPLAMQFAVSAQNYLKLAGYESDIRPIPRAKVLIVEVYCFERSNQSLGEAIEKFVKELEKSTLDAQVQFVCSVLTEGEDSYERAEFFSGRRIGTVVLDSWGKLSLDWR
jgi:hypothetical protein